MMTELAWFIDNGPRLESAIEAVGKIRVLLRNNPLASVLNE